MDGGNICFRSVFEKNKVYVLINHFLFILIKHSVNLQAAIHEIQYSGLLLKFPLKVKILFFFIRLLFRRVMLELTIVQEKGCSTEIG